MKGRREGREGKGGRRRGRQAFFFLFILPFFFLLLPSSSFFFVLLLRLSLHTSHQLFSFGEKFIEGIVSTKKCILIDNAVFDFSAPMAALLFKGHLACSIL